MNRNVAEIGKWAIVDACAVWNLLSSAVLFRACVTHKFGFSITEFVLYECLHKPRKGPSDADLELMRRLRDARQREQFGAVALTVDDLQDVMRLQLRRRVSKGELSSIAFARRAGITFQTDDQGARKLAVEELPIGRVQTTPHVLGWLYFHGKLADHELRIIIAEHEQVSRPLRKYLQGMYEEAMRCRSISGNNE